MRRMDEKGVSPVIGVILMVAITVILAAVIASFVFGMTGTVSKPKTPGISAYRVDNSTVRFTLYDLGGATEVKSCGVDGTGNQDFRGVGSNITLNINAGSGRHVIVCKVDGVDQVVWEGTI